MIPPTPTNSKYKIIIYCFTKCNQLLWHISFVAFSIQSKLFPTIFLYWQKYQKQREKVKAVKDGIVIAGDGRHDSMGHCAKYGAYTTLHILLHHSNDFALFSFPGKRCIFYD